MLLLGVAFTTEQANQVKIPIDEGDIGHIYKLAAYLSDTCDFKEPGMRFRICDSSGHPLLLTLVSNYGLWPNRDLSAAFKKLVEIVQKVLGPSMDVMWWLDYTMNHDADDYFVSVLP